MAQNVDGVALLGTGTSTLTGYIVEEVAETQDGEEVPIFDENGDVISEINGFGEVTGVRISVIVKSGTATPSNNDIITYTSKTHGGSLKFRLKNLESAEVQKDAVKWTMSGKRHPNITLS